MVVDLGDCLVGDGSGKLCGLRLLTLRERLVAFRQVAAAREHDAFALRQQHVVDAELLEASFAVESVLAAGLLLGARHTLTRRDDAGNANACGRQVAAQLLKPSGFPICTSPVSRNSMKAPIVSSLVVSLVLNENNTGITA